MQVLFRASFGQDLRNVSEAAVLARIKDVIKRVEEARSLQEVPNIKKLRGGPNYYRIRVGDYRIGLTVERDVVTLVRCLNRKEIYRHFP